MGEERGAFRIEFFRGGTIAEFTGFLTDLEDAYLAIYSLPISHDFSVRRHLIPYEFWPTEAWLNNIAGRTSREGISPEFLMEITRIRISSPGFMEVMASWSPLEQLREYLKDRHERRKDKEWREAGEKRKLDLENELLEQQVLGEKYGRIRDFDKLLHEIGLPQDQRRQALWQHIGAPLARLGRHQDTGLIGGEFSENTRDEEPPERFA